MKFISGRKCITCKSLDSVLKGRFVFTKIATDCDLYRYVFSQFNLKFLELTEFRIPTVKLKIPGKSRIQKFFYIQVIVFDLSYLPVAGVGI